MARALNEGMAVALAFTDERPPRPPVEVLAQPAVGGIRLQWNAAADDQHVAGYRVFRSDDPGFTQPKESLFLAEVSEERVYRDLAVSPGQTWSYSVTAIDAAGNESRPSRVVSATVSTGEQSFSFDAPNTIARSFTPQSGTWSPHDSAYGHSCTPDGTPIARTLLARPERADVDVGVKIWNPSGGSFKGGLLCRSSTQGGGYVLVLGGPAHDELILARLDGDAMVPLASMAYPYVVGMSMPHTLRLVVRGDSLAGYVDDRLLISARDSKYSRGQIGLVAMGGHVHFDNLMLSAMEPAAGGKAVGGKAAGGKPVGKKAGGKAADGNAVGKSEGTLTGSGAPSKSEGGTF
jgi:hypothetical protein